MMSPTVTRNTSPGTTVSESTETNVPSRLTSALSATDWRSASAARFAPPSWIVSKVTEAPRMIRMITALGASPVAAETRAAAIRIRHIGSSSLRPTEAISPASRACASALRPYLTSRAAASAEVRPATPHPRFAAAAAGGWFQNGPVAMGPSDRLPHSEGLAATLAARNAVRDPSSNVMAGLVPATHERQRRAAGMGCRHFALRAPAGNDVSWDPD